MRRLLAFVIGAFLSADPIRAAEHYAASAAELSAACAAAKPGDTIFLRDGEWLDADLLFTGEGTAGEPITLRAATPGQTMMRGRSRLRIGGRFLVVEGLVFDRTTHPEDVLALRADSKRLARDCRISDCAFIDCNPPDLKRETRWLSVYGARNRIERCLLRGKTNAGATLVVWLGEGMGEHTIARNYFGPRPRLGKNGGETIRLGDSKTSMLAARTVVEENLFEECNGEAEIISSKSCENIYRRNTFRRSRGLLTLRHGNSCTVEGNFFLGEKEKETGGVRVIGESHRIVNNYFADLQGRRNRGALVLVNGLRNSPLNGYFAASRATVAHNTFVNCREVFVVGESDPDAKNDVPPSECVIANNLVYGGGDLLVELTKPLSFRWSANIAAGIAAPPEGFASAAIDLQQDPWGAWRPRVAPALTTALPGLAEKDIDGEPRGASPHVGSDEVCPGEPAARPLQREDVGPKWRREGGQPRGVE